MIRVGSTQVVFGVMVVLLGAVGVTTPTEAALSTPTAGELKLISVSNTTPAVEANGPARNPSVSADGHYVAFESLATNLTSTPSTTWQVYVRDMVSGVTQLVSAAKGVAGDGSSRSPSISDDGNRIAYVTNALNLNTSGSPQAVLWSRDTGVNQVVSVSNGEPPNRANAEVTEPIISGDGLTVAFVSSATNLTREDTRGVPQVFVRDLSSRATSLVSRDWADPMKRGAASAVSSPSLSDDGLKVAFRTSAQLTNFDPDPGGRQQAYIATRDGEFTTMLSVDDGGARAADRDVTSVSISPDGHSIVFATAATNLTADPATGFRQIYTVDVSSPKAELVSYNAARTQGANGDCDAPSLSAFGDVAFSSTATDIDPAATNGRAQVYVVTSSSGLTMLASRTATGAAGDGPSDEPALSNTGSVLALASGATDLASNTSGSSSQVFLRDLFGPPRVERIDGADRFAVSAAVSKASFPPRAEVAYVASGTVFPDALAGGAAAGGVRAPVLLVTKDTIPEAVATELRRLRPVRIVLLGGTDTVSPAVEAALAAYSPTVRRIAAPDRFQLSAAICLDSNPIFNVRVFIASGEVYPDALAGSAAAGTAGNPVLLVGKDAAPESVLNELRRLSPHALVVLGGTSTVSDSVMTALQAVVPRTERIDGADRFAVSANISRWISTKFATNRSGTVYVASGAVFPDALSGSAVASQTGSPVLLVRSDTVPDSVKAELDRLKPNRIVILGGHNTVSQAVEDELAKHLRQS